MDEFKQRPRIQPTVAGLVWIVFLLTYCGVMITFSSWTTSASIIKDVILVIGSGLIALLFSFCPDCQFRLWGRRWMLLPFLIYAIVITIGFIHSDVPLLGTGQVTTFWAVIVCVIAILGLDLRQSHCRVFIGMLSALAVITVVYAFVQYSGHDPIPWEGFGGRVFSSFGHPNFFASFLIFVFPVLVLEYLHAKAPWWRLCLAIIISASLVALMLTRSRAAWLSFFSCLLLYPFFCMDLRWKMTKRTLVVIFGLTLVIVVVFIFNPAVSERFHSLFDMDDPSLQSRLLMYASIVPAIIEKPISGWGTGSFTAVFPLYHKPELYLIPPFNRERLVNNAHSEYLEILLENGLLGFASFLLILGVAFSKVPRVGRGGMGGPRVLVHGLLIGLFSILVQNLVCVSLRFLTTQFIFWTGLAFIVVLSSPSPLPTGLTGFGKRARTIAAISSLIVTTVFSWYAIDGTLQRYQAEVFTMKASHAQQRGDISLASYYCDQALSADAHAIETLNLQADLSLAQKKNTDAERALHQILTINPRYPLVHFHLAMININTGDTAQARILLKEAARWRPYAWQIEEAYGQLALASGDKEAATSHFRRTLELNQDAINAMFCLGNLEYEAGDCVAALSLYNRALFINSRAMGIWHNVGLVNKALRKQYHERRIKDMAQFDSQKFVARPLDPACAIQSRHSVISPDLGSTTGLSQSFLSACRSFSLIRFRIATGHRSFPYCFVTTLSKIDDRGMRPVSTQSVSLPWLTDNQWIDVHLATPPASARGATFVFEVMADPAFHDYPLFLWVQLKDEYHNGELTINTIPIGGDLEFEVH